MSPGRREFLILGAVAAGAAATGAIVGSLVVQSQSGAADLLAASLPDLSGRPRRLGEWQGRYVICNFWATWCGPCREELPLLDAAQQQHAASGLQVVGIAIDTAPNVREYLKIVKIGFPVLVGEARAIGLMRSLGNKSGGLPFTVILDRNGIIRTRRVGAYSEAGLRAELTALLR